MYSLKRGPENFLNVLNPKIEEINYLSQRLIITYLASILQLTGVNVIIWSLLRVQLQLFATHKMKQRNSVKINTYLFYWWSPDWYVDILQRIYLCMKTELKTSENKSMQETKNDLFMDWVSPIKKENQGTWNNQSN